MTRYIDADALPKVKFHDLPYTHIYPADLIGLQTEVYERGWNDAIDAIVENTETADVVDVVRCKDCIVQTICRFKTGLGENGFCSQGERREDAEIH